MGFEDRVRNLIKQHYTVSDLDIGFGGGAHKLHGYVVSTDFSGKEMLDRQTDLYSFLRDELGAEAQQISIIFTYTPDEFKLMAVA